MNSNDDLDLDTDLAPASKTRHQAAAEPARYSRAATESDSTVPESHILDYVRVLYKRRWTAAAAFLTILGIAVIYSFTATPVFEARSRLLIETDEQNVVSFQQVVDENQTRAD